MSRRDPRHRNDAIAAASVAAYFDGYAAALAKAVDQVSRSELDRALRLLKRTVKNKKRVFVGGNGGSSAISDHLCCDWTKGTYESGQPPLRVHSMTSNTALFTALANDFGYKESIARQIQMYGERGDVAVLVSSSGNSPNILRAADAAAEKGMPVVGFCGFSGGRLRELANVKLYVPANNYGIVEDVHQMLMHTLAQFLAAEARR